MPSTTAALVALWDCDLDYKRTYMALRNFAEATRRGYASDLRLFIALISRPAPCCRDPRPPSYDLAAGVRTPVTTTYLPIGSV